MVTLDGPTAGCITPQMGSGTLYLDEQKVLHYDISYDGLVGDELESHLHGQQTDGSTQRILIDLPMGTPKVGSTDPLTPGMEADLLAGTWYIIVHTSHCPSGELRGVLFLAEVPNDSSSWGTVKALYGDR